MLLEQGNNYITAALEHSVILPRIPATYVHNEHKAGGWGAFDSPTMLSRSTIACFSCFWDILIMSTVSVKVWHTALLPSSFPASSVMLMLQFKVVVMPCSWAKSAPVEPSSEENCFTKASRASARTKSTKQIKPYSDLGTLFHREYSPAVAL